MSWLPLGNFIILNTFVLTHEDPDLVSKLLGYNSIAIVEKKGRLGNHVSLMLGVFPGHQVLL